MKVNTSTFISCESDFEDADIVIYGAPFDSTTSFRPGTRFGPQHIRTDSYGLETYSPYLDKDLEDYKILDIGDLDLPFGSPKKALDIIEETGNNIFKENKKALLLGGEHLVSLGNIRAAFNKYEDMVLIHFDAHTDLREDYMGEKLSHASVIKRAWDFLGDNRIYQFCIRSGERQEFEWAREHTYLEKFTYTSLDEKVDQIGKERPVYITIDLDVFDPSLFSGTGTPEPGGIFWNDMISILKSLSKLNIIGADIVELSPQYDPSGVSTAVACKVLRELLLIMS